MTINKLTKAYVQKGAVRIKALRFLHQEGGYSDVIREAQECVELLLKGLLRHLGIEAPKTHDVSHILKEKRNLFPPSLQAHLDEIAIISRTLRKERELAFYGAEDWIPTEEYGPDESLEAIGQTEKIFNWVLAALGDQYKP